MWVVYYHNHLASGPSQVEKLMGKFDGRRTQGWEEGFETFQRINNLGGRR